MLCAKFQNEGFVVKQAEEYADYLIIKSALEIEKRSQCGVVFGKDIDFLVIIAASTNSENILLLKPGRGKAEDALYCAETLNAGEEEIYQCSELQQVVNIFRDENACPDDIDEAGQKVLIALYGRKKSEETRDSLIFKLFQKSLVLSLPLQQLHVNALSVHTYRFNIGVDLPKDPYIGVGKKPNMDCSQSPLTRNQLLQPFSL
ncbi:hypothetical protein AVEN_175313-1 [Araneus ventricosus]|uniref:Uncharacterized protein n=1 Tax=Araneus ventricosus TaxID=182803 RepID=A0A4Y2GG36_ARAVE|nr:hypothetical protein AVEN_175313-1 [Araneus ventricosus]